MLYKYIFHKVYFINKIYVNKSLLDKLDCPHKVSFLISSVMKLNVNFCNLYTDVFA